MKLKSLSLAGISILLLLLQVPIVASAQERDAAGVAAPSIPPIPPPPPPRSPASLLPAEVEKVGFFAYWDKGDTVEYRIIEQIDSITNGIVEGRYQEMYNVRIVVLDSIPDYYTLSYKITEWVDLYGEEKDAPLPDSVKYYEVIYRTDNLGAFLHIVNWEQLGHNTALISRLLDQKASSEGERGRALQEQIDEIASNKEAVQALFTQKIELIHSPMGASYNPHDTLSFESYEASPFGKGTIEYESSMFFTEVDTNYSYARMILVSEGG